MFASRFDPDRTDPSALRRNREAFLDFLSTRIDFSAHRTVSIVFDAEKKIEKLPDQFHYRGMEIYFAQDHVSADDLIEELIKMDSVPKKLLVVSSDHRLQRAAKRRGAQWRDSDEWFDQLLASRSNSESTSTDEKPPINKPFDLPDLDSLEKLIADELERESVEDLPRDSKDEMEKDGQSLESDNPFPEGYGDDLA